MGKHAAPRTPILRGRTAQRAFAVSAGTFVLCLGAAAPAIATTGLPTPPPLPQPIGDAVQTVSNIAGVPDPLAPPKTPKAKHHHRDGSKQAAAKPQQPTAHKVMTPAAPAQVKPATPSPVTTFAVGGLRAAPTTRPAAVSERAPAMATAPAAPKTTRIVPTAGERALGLALPPTQDTARILIVALAMTIVGGLASGHIKAAQSRAFA